MRAFLSGTPECIFGLNDKLVVRRGDRSQSGAAPGLAAEAGGAVELDDCHFHPCVRLEEFETDRTITFIPPDGEFELMKQVNAWSLDLNTNVHVQVSIDIRHTPPDQSHSDNP